MTKIHHSALTVFDFGGHELTGEDRRKALAKFRLTGAMFGAYFERVGGDWEDETDPSTWGPESQENVDWTGFGSMDDSSNHVRLAHRLPLYTRDPEAVRMVAALGDLSEADEATLLRCAHLARAIAGNVGFKLERGSDGLVLTFDSVRGRLPEWYGRQLPAYRLLSKLLMLAMDAQTYHSYCGNPDVVQRLGLAIKAIEPTDFELQWLKDTARRFGDRSTADRSIAAGCGYVVDKYWCVEVVGRLFRSPQEGPVEWDL